MGAVNEPRLLAFDGGNSKTDVLLVALDGTVIARARSGPFTPHIIGAGPAVATVAPAVEHVIAVAGLTQVDVVVGERGANVGVVHVEAGVGARCDHDGVLGGRVDNDRGRTARSRQGDHAVEADVVGA